MDRLTEKATLSGGALAVSAALLWAGNFVVGRAIHVDVDALTLNLARWSLVAALLAPVLVLRHRDVRTALRRHPVRLVVLATLGVALFNTTLYAGLQRIGAAQAGMIFALTPGLVLLIEAVGFGAGLRRRQVAGLCLSLAGVAASLGRPALNGDLAVDAAGVALVLAASGIWAGYTVGLRRLDVPLSPLTFLAMIATLGAVLMLPVALWRGLDVGAARAAPGLAAALAYLALGASLAAFCAWRRAVTQMGPAAASSFLQLVPVFSVVGGAVFLNEPLRPLTLAGFAGVILGIAIAASAPTRTRP